MAVGALLLVALAAALHVAVGQAVQNGVPITILGANTQWRYFPGVPLVRRRRCARDNARCVARCVARCLWPAATLCLPTCL
jgi:hypothetical protein